MLHGERSAQGPLIQVYNSVKLKTTIETETVDVPLKTIPVIHFLSRTAYKYKQFLYFPDRKLGRDVQEAHVPTQ